MRISLLSITTVLAMSSTASAQELPIFDGSHFGKVVITDNQSGQGRIRNEALIGAQNIEFISNYSTSSPFAQLGRAVGKLDILTDTNKFAPCTAFLIADNRLVTNYHCVPGVLDHPQIGGNSIAALQVHFGFIRDGIKGDTQSFHVSPVPLEMNEALDYTVLKVLGDPNSEFGALELSATVPEDRAPFWVIGHPLGEAQRISREKCQASSPAIEGNRLLHTCDTMPGSSGSPVIDAGLRQVIALHNASAGSVNLAVPMAEILGASKILVAALVKSGGDNGAAQLAALQKALADAQAKNARFEAAALAERTRLANEAATLAAAPKDTIPDSAQFSRAYWKKTRVELSGHKREINSAAFSPDGTRIVTASWDKTARIWNAQSGEQIATLAGHKKAVYSAAFSPDGTRIVTASRDNTARVWNAQSGAMLVTLAGHEDYIYFAAFSPDGTRIVTTSEDTTARVWDAQSGAMLATLAGHGRDVNSAAFSPNGARIATASDDKTARIWDAKSGEQIATLVGHEHFVYRAIFSPDGMRILTASSDGTARVWDTQSGAMLVTLAGHGRDVNSAAFSLDGTRIVTASSDGTARVWDAQSGAMLATLSGLESHLTFAAFSPDGMRILTVSEDNTARIWGAD